MLKSVKSLIKKCLPSSVVDLLHINLVRLKVSLGIPIKQANDKIRFEVHLAEHCNLNCAGCDHFSPLAEPAFIDIDTFRKDLERLGSLFSHKCQHIHLLGGEPLLNPDIIALMKIARDNFSEGSIQIVTNGVLLPSMSDDFWRACHDNDIEVRMTNYPLKLDIDKIRATADKFAVKFSYYGKSETKSIMYKAPLDLSGKGNMKVNFALCDRGNGCIFLRQGKLYPCTMIPNVHFFNKAFNQNIPVTEADCVDIYSDITPEEILKRLAQPVPACRYCDIQGKSWTVAWHVSKREMSEWV